MEKNYNVRETSKILGLTVRTVRQWIHDGKIKAVQYARRGKWYISETEINRIRSGKKD